MKKTVNEGAKVTRKGVDKVGQTTKIEKTTK